MLIDTPQDATPKSVRIFCVLLILFAGIIGGLVLLDGERFFIPGIVLAVAWAIGVIPLRSDKAAWFGALIPAVLIGITLGVRSGVEPMTIAIVLWVVGGIAALVGLASHHAGSAIMLNWTRAASPIGWTISTLVLAVVYYLVLTPIGLIMRVVGYDPMHRKIDRDATTYWIARESQTDAKRYFRQF